MGPEDLTLDDAFDGEDRWEYYRSSYSLRSATEGIGAAVGAPFLPRCAVPSRSQGWHGC
jgi:histone deacetylase complex regulatory component SIN3